MAPITLYHSTASAHSRGALFTIRNLGLDVDIKLLNLPAKEQLNPDFVKINPQHCVPTIVDGDFILWESRAIAVYLIEAKVADSPLYPQDVKERALVNQRLYFDAGTLYKRIRDICFPIIYLGETTIPDDKRKALFEAFDWLNGFLQGNDYIAGPTVTVADLFAVSSMLSIVSAGCDIGAYKNIVAWLDRCKTLPGYDENVEGAKVFGQRVTSRLTDKF